MGLGVAVGCGRSPEAFFGIPEVCLDIEDGNLRREGEPSPVAVGACDELESSAPLYGCSDNDSCDRAVLRCDPSTDLGSGTHRCCSDDPTSFDGGIPRFAGGSGAGSLALFAGEANDRGTSGVCVRTELVDVSLTEGGARGCPVPCNPTWEDGDVAAVCGSGRVCCQTTAVDRRDCVRDPITMRWRAVDGNDINVSTPDGDVLTNWGRSAHVTHQDPGGKACAEMAGISGNDSNNPEFLACIRRLTVANQRGFCTEASECCVSPDYVDKCEQLN